MLQRVTDGDYTNNVKQWLTCNSDSQLICSSDWADESSKLACSNAYVMSDGATHIKNNYVLDDKWYYRNLPIVEQQIAKAGVRLAALLNTVFQSTTKQTTLIQPPYNVIVQ